MSPQLDDVRGAKSEIAATRQGAGIRKYFAESSPHSGEPRLRWALKPAFWRTAATMSVVARVLANRGYDEC
jgi:hypothetical protein